MKQKQYINNLNEVALTIGQYDKATETELFWGNKSYPQELKKWKGVYNINTEKVCQVVSKNYQIIQYNDVVSAMVESLGGLNINVKGTINNYNDKIKLDLVFNNQGVPVKDDKEGIQIGIRVLNSYDKSTSFRLEMFGYRLVCQNGMSFGKTMGIREITFHTGEKKPLEEIKAITQKFVKEVIKSHQKVQDYVDACMQDSVEWNLAKKILEKLIVTKKHYENLVEIIRNGKYGENGLTRWDIYNALTNYISHDEALKPTVISNLEKKSQVLLTNDFEKLQEKYVEVKNETEI